MTISGHCCVVDDDILGMALTPFSTTTCEGRRRLLRSELDYALVSSTNIHTDLDGDS
jgi:hypothetical protein